MRVVRTIGMLVLGLAGALAAQNGAGAPGRRMVNPESVAARLMLATPEQRQRALTLLPPERQAQIRKQLEWFDSLPKAQQELQIRRLERFANMPPGQQAIVRLQMQALARLAPGRRQAIRRALVLLQSLPPGRRAARMNSPAFESRFSPDELKIVQDLSNAWLLSPAQSATPGVPK